MAEKRNTANRLSAGGWDVAVAASDSSKKVRRAAGDHSLARCLMDSAVRGELAISPAAARDADATALVVSKRCAVACAALAKLAQAPCRGAVIQGGFVKDSVVALRRLAAAAHAPASRVSYTVRSSRNARAEALLGTLVSATMYPDAQRALLDEPQTAELLLDLCHYYGAPQTRSYSSPAGVDYTPTREPLYPGARARTEHVASSRRFTGIGSLFYIGEGSMLREKGVLLRAFAVSCMSLVYYVVNRFRPDRPQFDVEPDSGTRYAGYILILKHGDEVLAEAATTGMKKRVAPLLSGNKDKK